jgi:hypothetical protein
MMHLNLITHLVVVAGRASSSLQIPRGATLPNTSLPGGNALGEHLLDLLQSLSGSLGEEEEDVEGHSQTEHTENKVHPPLDVLEGGRNEVSKGKVENLISVSFTSYYLIGIRVHTQLQLVARPIALPRVRRVKISGG